MRGCVEHAIHPVINLFYITHITLCIQHSGSFGVRIESVCVTVEAKTAHNFNDKRYCKLDTGIVNLCLY